jgi:hypothetical protein
MRQRQSARRDVSQLENIRRIFRIILFFFFVSERLKFFYEMIDECEDF